MYNMHELHMNVPINAIFENDATNAKKIVALWNKFQPGTGTFPSKLRVIECNSCVKSEGGKFKRN